MVAADDAFAHFAAHGQFADHDHEAHKDRQEKVCDQEGEAAGLAHLVREAPDVAKTYGRADGRQQEADIASPRTSLIFQNNSLLSYQTLSYLPCLFFIQHTIFFRSGQDQLCAK